MKSNNKYINFSQGPSIYWSNATKVSYLQRRVIVHSILYYELDSPIITDEQYNTLSLQLVQMMKEVSKEELKETTYWYCMYDFDGSTGFDLFGRLNSKDQHYLMELSNSILKLQERR